MAINDYALGTVSMLDTGAVHASPATLISGVASLGIAVDKVGNLYVSNYNTNQIDRFSASGASLGVFATALHPYGLAFDPTGNLWVANEGWGAISKYSSTGLYLGAVLVPSYDPWDPTFDSSGNLYVLDPIFSKIHKYSSGGADLGVFASVASGLPGGLAFDSTGNLFISSTSGIRKFSPSGTDLGLFAPFFQAGSLVFDDLGNLYVASSVGGYIRRFSSSGVDLGDFTVLPFGTGTYSALAFVPTPEPSGLLLVALGLTSLVVFAHCRSTRKRLN